MGSGCGTFQNQARNSAKKRVTVLIFGMVVAVMMFITDLCRNGGSSFINIIKSTDIPNHTAHVLAEFLRGF